MSRRLVYGDGKLASLAPIGEVNGVFVYPFFGADDGGDGDDADADVDEDDAEDGESDKDGEDDDAAKDGKKPRQQKRSDDGSSVLNRVRKELRASRKELSELKEKQRKADLADKSEVERAQAELKDAQQKVDELEPKLRKALTELEIIKASNRLKLQWADIEDVLNDRKLQQAIEVDDDGELIGVEDALKDLKSRKPHFLAKPEDADDGTDDDGDSDSDDTKKKTGAKFNSSKSKQKNQLANRQMLEKKYAVLGTMVDSPVT